VSALSSTYTFLPTEDGSPSLRLGPVDVFSESMHSLKGAFSETVYIYGTAIERCLAGLGQRFSVPGAPSSVLGFGGGGPKFFSLGLGLGYVEVLAAALILKAEAEFPGVSQIAGGESFEIVPDLREWFVAWVSGESVRADFQTAYDDIHRRTAAETGISEARIRTQMHEMIQSGRWKIRPALEATTEFTERFHCICCDAFSSKTSPDLWSEEFLTAFFQKVAAESCVLATYACTGALKRTLRTAGFELKIREGFSSKRDSTFAVRGF
jgi:hypothetical protein